MPRRNHSRRGPKRINILDHYDTDFVDLPDRPELLYLRVEPLKTIFRNSCAACGATKVRVIKRFDDQLCKLLSSKE